MTTAVAEWPRENQRRSTLVLANEGKKDLNRENNGDEWQAPSD
jgi:hypothetical protein